MDDDNDEKKYKFYQVNDSPKFKLHDIVKSPLGNLYRIIGVEIENNRYRIASLFNKRIAHSYRDIPRFDETHEFLHDAASKGGRKKRVRSTNRKTSHKKRRSNKRRNFQWW
jgi:hypothetical protein